MAYTGTATKRNGPACSLHYFSSCACLPFPHATACFVLAREFLWLYDELETDVDSKLFSIPTKNFSPLEGNCEATALHAASEIPPNFNKLSLYWRQCYCLFPSQTTSWALIQAPNWPLFSTACLGLSASHYLHIAAALCGTFTSNWHQCMRAPPCTCSHREQISCSSVPYDLWFASWLSCKLCLSSSCIHLCFSLSAPSLLCKRPFLLQ